MEPHDTHLMMPPNEKNKSSPNAKIARYVDYLFSKYDVNRDGYLQRDEWKRMHGHPDLISPRDDGSFSREEFRKWILAYVRRKQSAASNYAAEALENGASSASELTPRERTEATAETTGDSTPAAATTDEIPNTENGGSGETDASQPAARERRRDQKYYVPSKRLPEGLPDWFFERDKDGDGQLTVGEFSISGGNAELAEFKKLDANGDGVLTAKECVRKVADKQAASKAEESQLPAANEKKDARNRKKTRPVR